MTSVLARLTALRPTGRIALMVLCASLIAGVGLATNPRFVRATVIGLKKWVSATQEAHPNALWHVVHDLCVRNQRVFANPAPCLKVDLARGYAIIKDPERRSQLLLVPTSPASGIEARFLAAPAAENYWYDAWTTLSLFERRLGKAVPRTDFALAVNSRLSRTQDQLHIHIDCVRPQVRAVLAAERSRLGGRWIPLSFPFLGDHYQARWIDGQTLETANPFRVLVRDLPRGVDPGAYALALVGAIGADGRPGFVLIRSRETPSDYGAPSGEALLDHHCRVLDSPGA